MGWRKLTPADMIKSFTPSEMKLLMAVQNANSGLNEKLNIVVPEFIGAMSAAQYVVNKDGSVPDQLRRHIMAMTVWAWLSDFPTSLKAFKTDAREKAAADAERIYEKICARTYGAIEAPYGTDFVTGNWNSETKLLLRTHPTPTPAQQFQTNPSDPPFYANPNAPTDDVPAPAIITPNDNQITYYYGNALINGNVVTLVDANNNPLLPTNPQADAIATPASGVGNTFTWNVSTQSWNS